MRAPTGVRPAADRVASPPAHRPESPLLVHAEATTTRRLLALAAAVLLALTVLPGPADAQSLSQARERRAELQAKLDAAAESLNELETRRAELEDEAAGLDQELGELEAEIAAARGRIASRVRTLYKHGSNDPVVVMLTGSDPADALERATKIRQLVGADRLETERAVNAGVRVGVVASQLATAREQLSQAVAEQERLTSEIQADLEEAQALEARLEAEERRRREEEARRAAAAAAAKKAAAQQQAASSSSSGSRVVVGGGGMACPVAKPHSFTNTWGAPRSGGRRHKGTDILAPRGQTVVAIVDGVWDRRPRGASAGLWGILKGSDGNSYYYMHLDSHVAGDGARVKAGQQIGTNGDTGNARGTTPHVHFEIHPGGGGAINPYPTLKRICG